MRVGVFSGIATAIAIGALAGGGPTQTNACFSAPGACGFPDPNYANVGVPAGTVLTPSGAITVSIPGTVISGLDITTATSPAINVTANNVTIQNTRITGQSTGGGPPAGSDQRLINTCGGCNTTIRNVELTTSATGIYEFAVHGPAGSPHANDYLDHVYQHGNIDMLLWCEGTCSVTDSYTHLGKPDGSGGWVTAVTDDHTENLYCNDCTFTATHNTVFLPMAQTATLFGQTNNGTDGQPCINHVTMTNNLLAGGGRILEVCAHALNVGTATATITNNRIARCDDGNEVDGGGGTWICPGLTVSHNDGEGYYPRGGSFSLAASYYDTVFTWSGNVWDKDGSTIPEP